jgi:hypothetical protein
MLPPLAAGVKEKNPPPHHWQQDFCRPATSSFHFSSTTYGDLQPILLPPLAAGLLDALNLSSSHFSSRTYGHTQTLLLPSLPAGLVETVTAGYFYNTFAYEIRFYGIYFYGIYIYGIYIYKALKFLSIDCTVVRNT